MPPSVLSAASMNQNSTERLPLAAAGLTVAHTAICLPDAVFSWQLPQAPHMLIAQAVVYQRRARPKSGRSAAAHSA
jgi:hypothetical protein